MFPVHLLEKNKMDCLNQEAERSPKIILILQETADKTEVKEPTESVQIDYWHQLTHYCKTDLSVGIDFDV